MNKTLSLLILSAALMTACGNDDDTASPAKSTGSIEGKWTAVKSDVQVYDANNNLTDSRTDTTMGGLQWEFLANGVFNEYTNFTLDETGTYTRQDKKVTITIPQKTIAPFYIETLTSTNLGMRDTTRLSSGIWAVRVTHLKK